MLPSAFVVLVRCCGFGGVHMGPVCGLMFHRTHENYIEQVSKCCPRANSMYELSGGGNRPFKPLLWSPSCAVLFSPEQWFCGTWTTDIPVFVRDLPKGKASFLVEDTSEHFTRKNIRVSVLKKCWIPLFVQSCSARCFPISIQTPFLLQWDVCLWEGSGDAVSTCPCFLSSG